MGDPSGDATLPAPEPAPTPAALPVVDRAHYDVLTEHARGGLGRILRARDRRTGRLVAIKEMLPGAREAGPRFFREAMITANLQHPAIVPVYELGQWPDGEPFYAMKLVAGASLDRALRDAKTLRDRLAMLPRLVDVAEAMAYAHGEGVIHRDLKPANVLVGAYGETVVIDWGLAAHTRDLEPEGAVMGTPAYMPPEQARGAQVDARADVYAVGAMLYQLLSGHVPYEDSGSADEILARIKAGPPRSLAELEPGLPPDLLAIVTKAMAPDRAARYATARELAEDLRRFTTGQLVGAHAYSTWQLLRRFVRRNRAAVAVASVLVTALAITGVVAFRKVTAERNLAEQRNRHLILSQARGAIDRDPTLALAWLQQLPAGAPEWREARRIASDARERGVARWVFTGHTANVNDVVFTPDDRTLISASDDATLRVWDLATGAARVIEQPEPIDFILPTPDGAGMITLGPWRSDDVVGRPITAWDLATLTPRPIAGVPGQRDADALLSPDGKRLAVIDCNAGVRVIELATLTARTLRASTSGERPTCANIMAFTPDGAVLAAESATSDVDLIDVATGAVTRTLPTAAGGSVLQADVTPDGGRVIVLTYDELASWGRTDGDRVVIVPNQHAVRGFEVNHDGSRLAIAGTDHTVRAWTAADGAYRVLASFTADLSQLVLAPDQRRLVSSALDGLVQISDFDGRWSRTLHGHAGAITQARVSHDGAWVASSSDDGTIRVWSMDGARRTWNEPSEDFSDLVLARDGRSFVSSSYDGSVTRWSLDGAATPLRAKTARVPHPEPIAEAGDVLAIARPDGGVDVWTGPGATPRRIGTEDVAALEITSDAAALAWVGQDGAVRWWRPGDAAPRALADPHLEARRRRALARSPDDATLVWADRDGALGVFDARHDRTRTIAAVTGEIRGLVFVDATTVIATSTTGEVMRCDLASGVATLLFRHAVNADDFGRVAVSPDGRRLASADATHAIRITELATGASRTWPGHTDEVLELAFSPDGRTLASGARDTTARIWDLATGDSRVLPHHDAVSDVTWTDDGRLITATFDGTFAVVLDDVPRDEPALRAFLRGATNLVVDPQAP